MNNSALQDDVMRRVYFIHTARKLAKPMIPEVVCIIALVFAETFFVSFSDVYANAAGTETVGSFLWFFVQAFLSTNFIVQAMTVGIAIAGAFLTRQVYRQSTKLLSYLPLSFFRFNILK